jgi:2-oxoglutarate dehydrogenase E1 component
VASSPRELSEGRFQSVLDDMDRRSRGAAVRRLVLCSGKVFVDLIGSERRQASADVAICRVEQLYPFPGVALRETLAGYPNLSDVVWLQEEPENMGAWEFMRPLLEELIGDRCPLRYVGRARASSPSEGSTTWHQLNQKALVEQAFDLASHASDAPLVLSKKV